MKKLIPLLCLFSLLYSCKKKEDRAPSYIPENNPGSTDTIASPADTTATSPADTSHPVPFKLYLGEFKYINNCGPGFSPVTNITAINSFYVQNNHDTLLRTFIGSPCADCYAAIDYDSVHSIGGGVNQFFRKHNPYHQYATCTLKGDTIHACLSIFHCSIGYACDVWSDYYYFDGVKAP